MSINHLLNRTVTVTRSTSTSDGSGSNPTTPAVIATIRAKIDSARASDRMLADQDTDRVTHTIYFNPGSDIVRDDVINDGTTDFKILSLLPPSRAHHLKTLAEVSDG